MTSAVRRLFTSPFGGEVDPLGSGEGAFLWTGCLARLPRRRAAKQKPGSRSGLSLSDRVGRPIVSGDWGPWFERREFACWRGPLTLSLPTRGRVPLRSCKCIEVIERLQPPPCLAEVVEWVDSDHWRVGRPSFTAYQPLERAVAVLELLARAAGAGGIAGDADQQLGIDRAEAAYRRRAASLLPSAKAPAAKPVPGTVPLKSLAASFSPLVGIDVDFAAGGSCRAPAAARAGGSGFRHGSAGWSPVRADWSAAPGTAHRLPACIR